MKNNFINPSALNYASSVQFHDVFDVDDLQRMQDAFSAATGVASVITTPSGVPITKPTNFCRLCKDIIRKTDLGLANCMKSDAVIGGNNQAPYTIACCLSGGLWDAGVPIVLDGNHLANWLIGQVKNDKQDETKMLEYAKRIGADQRMFMEALDEVPVMSQAQFEDVTKLLHVFSNQLAEKAYVNMQLKKQILERENAFNLLYDSEQSASVLLHSIGDGVIATDNNGLITIMNPVAERMCGWSAHEAKNRPLHEVFYIVNDQTGKRAFNPVVRVLVTGEVVALENHTILYSRSGHKYHISDSAAPVKAADGSVNGVVLVFSDVTKEYEAAEKLKEAERSKSVLLSNLPGIAYRCKFDKEWTMEFISEGCTRLTGYQPVDLLNNNKLSFNDIILPEYRDHLWLQWIKAVQSHGSICEEYKIRTAQNEVRWVWEQGIPIYNDNGEVEALEGMVIDITDRKQAEEKLFNEHLLLRTIIDNIPDSIYSKDIDGRKKLVNAAELRFAGVNSEADIIGKTDFDIYPYELANAFHSDDLKVIHSGLPIINKEEVLVDENGENRWILTSKIPLRCNDNNICGLIGIGRDITVRKKALDNMRESEEKYRKLFDNVRDVFFQINMQGIILEISPSVKYFSDFDRDELINSSVLNVYANPEDRSVFLERLNREGEVNDYEIHLIAKNGVLKYVSINARLVHCDPPEMSYIDGSIRDITERKIVEKKLQESQEQLKNFAAHLQLVREEERVSLAREIHDELGQILIAMKIDLGMLKQKVLKNKEIANSTDILLKFEHLFELVDNTIKTTRKIMTDLRPEVLYLLGFVEAVKRLVDKFQKRYTINCRLNCDVPMLSLDIQQSVALYRILQEALTNVARHAKATEVVVHIWLENQSLCMEIADDGIGFDQKKQTKSDSYGLVGMRERIFLLDGDLSFTSSVNNGTVIHIQIPYVSAAIEE